MFESGEMFEPDWDKINKERDLVKKLLKDRFADENDGRYEVHDYFEPPEDDSIYTTCNFCEKHVLIDTEEMVDHLIENHLDKWK